MELLRIKDYGDGMPSFTVSHLQDSIFFRTFAGIFAEGVKGKSVGDEVAKFRRDFLTMQFCFAGKDMVEQRTKLLSTFWAGVFN